MEPYIVKMKKAVETATSEAKAGMFILWVHVDPP